MPSLFDNVHVLGLTIQALGAALIGMLCLMLNRVVQRPALSAWSAGWLSLAVALIALLVQQAMPRTSAFTLPMYMFGEYLYGYFLISGCAHFAGRRWPAGVLQPLLTPAAVVAIAMPQLIGYEFRNVFLVQATLLSGFFIVALLALRPAVKRYPSSPGLLAMRIALALLIVNFLYYIPIFGANLLFNEPLPMTALKLSSAAHLVFEFVLGFGGAVLVLEQSHRTLAVRNRDLLADNRRFRIEAEQDALTDTCNRHAFFHLLDELAMQRHMAHGCVAVLDVDDMKAINDRYGHAAGDAALVRVANTLRSLVRRDDHLFRWGGDEFLLVTIDLDGIEFRSRLESLNARLRSNDAPVQVSHGYAEFERADQLLDAVRRADVAMYAQKRERAALRRRAGINVIEGGSRGAVGGPRDLSV